MKPRNSLLLMLALTSLGAMVACGDSVTAAGEEAPIEPDIPVDKDVLADFQHFEAHTRRDESLRAWDGSVEGMKTLWHDNGAKAGEGEFRHDEKHGPWVFWYPSGQMRWEGSFIEDVEEGEERAWYENGELYYEGTVLHGKREGIYGFYYENGQLWWRGQYIKGRKHGTFEYFRRDGTPDEKLSGYYEDGKRVTS